MSKQLVLLEVEDSIATVALNRPTALNSLDLALRDQFTAVINQIKTSRDVRVVILTGVGSAFCSGLDSKELAQHNENGAKAAPRGLLGVEMLEAISSVDIPLIGAINGFAISEGLELALFCDVLIASTRAQFADGHARSGLVPAWGMSQKLPRLIGLMRAKELSLTGNYFSAQQALEWGMVNRVVKPEELLPTCRRLAKDMLECDVEAQVIIKDLMNRGWQETMDEGLAMERRVSEDRMREFKSANKSESNTMAPGKDSATGQRDWLAETID